MSSTADLEQFSGNNYTSKSTSVVRSQRHPRVQLGLDCLRLRTYSPGVMLPPKARQNRKRGKGDSNDRHQHSRVTAIHLHRGPRASRCQERGRQQAPDGAERPTYRSTATNRASRQQPWRTGQDLNLLTSGLDSKPRCRETCSARLTADWADVASRS